MHLEAVRERIAKAAERAGRSSEGITIVAVTKTHPPSVVLHARALGLLDVGENKVQEALGKQEQLAGETDLRWHLIGHLQRNKAKHAVGRFALIHSLDSIRLADVLEREAAEQDITQDVLIQVNVAKEEQKSGVAIEELDALVEHTMKQRHLALKGFMTMAPFTDDDRAIRRAFRELSGIGHRASGIGQPILSMGMSSDYEIAVEEGATMLRLGTILFGERRP